MVTYLHPTRKATFTSASLGIDTVILRADDAMGLTSFIFAFLVNPCYNVKLHLHFHAHPAFDIQTIRVVLPKPWHLLQESGAGILMIAKMTVSTVLLNYSLFQIPLATFANPFFRSDCVWSLKTEADHDAVLTPQLRAMTRRRVLAGRATDSEDSVHEEGTVDCNRHNYCHSCLHWCD